MKARAALGILGLAELITGACSSPMYFVPAGGGAGGEAESVSGAGGSGSTPVCAPHEDCATTEDDDCDGKAPDCTGLHLWSRRFGDAGIQRGEGVSVDGSGNVALTGLLQGSVDFGGGPLNGGAKESAFVARFDSDGNHLFSKRIGDGNTQAYAIATDGDGAVVVAGLFTGALQTDNGALTTADGADVFAAKLDASGNLLWVRSLGGDMGWPPGYAVCASTDGNILVAGSFSGTIELGNGSATAAGSSDVFLVKLDPSGEPLWGKTFGGPLAQAAHSVAVDQDSNVLVAGSFTGSIDFGGDSLLSAGSEDAFVAKLDASGQHIWSRRLGSAGSDTASGVSTDASGNVIVVGTLSIQGPDVFVAKLDAAGADLWMNTYGDPAAQQAYGVDVDAVGHITLAGQLSGTIDFGGANGELTSPGTNIFVAKLDESGHHLWSKRLGDGSQLATAVASDGSGAVIVTGNMAGTMDVGSEILTNAGSWDVFLLKLAQ